MVATVKPKSSTEPSPKPKTCSLSLVIKTVVGGALVFLGGALGNVFSQHTRCPRWNAEAQLIDREVIDAGWSSCFLNFEEALNPNIPVSVFRRIHPRARVVSARDLLDRDKVNEQFDNCLTSPFANATEVESDRKKYNSAWKKLGAHSQKRPLLCQRKPDYQSS